MKKIFFTPGPTQLYESVPEYIKEAIHNNICSISHRSKEFEQIFQNAVSGLKKLLAVPNDSHIFFLGSATEAMERIIENCVAKHSFHFIDGEFSKRFFETAVELKKFPQKFEAAIGDGFDFGIVAIDENAELICFTQNETSTGIAVNPEDIYRIKKEHPDKIVAVDIVSSVPYVNIDYRLVDCAFFSVQKGFGLPAGLGIVIVNENAIKKSQYLQEKGYSIGSYHSFLSLLKSAQKNQTPETPNVLGIYLLGKVCDELNEIGTDRIRSDTEKKASLIYDFFDAHKKFKPFVKNKNFRSKTVIAIDTLEDTQKIKQRLAENGIVVGSGYKELKDKQIRIANFPMHKMEDVEGMLGYIE